MTTDREFDRIATAWLADGPVELSDRVLDAVVDEIHLTRQRRASRVPWRFPTMTMPARVVALIAIGALILAGVAVVGGAGRGGPSPSQAPAASAPAAVEPTGAVPTVLSTAGLPVLDTLFASPRNGYSVKYPASWTATPATAPWPQGSQAPEWGDPTADEIRSGDVRLIGAQQGFADGQTDDAWIKAYCGCSDLGSLPTTKVAGYTGYITSDGLRAAGGTIVPGGTFYDVAIPVSPRGYVFTLDGNVDRAMLDAFLSTVSFQPYNAIDTPRLTGRFTSPTYGYSIGTVHDWTFTPSTKAWTDTSNSSEFMDTVDIAGTSSGVGAMSQPLGDRTFDDFLSAFEAEQHAVGCGGGPPSTWQTIQIGDQTGVYYDRCNSTEALVQAGDRVYLFESGDGTLDRSSGFSLAEFKQLLTSVSFDPASAK